VDPRQAALLEELGARYQPDLANPESPVARALAATEPVLYDVSPALPRTLTRDPVVLGLIEALAPIALLVVPLTARGESLGTICLAMSTSGRSFRAQDRTAAELFAARAALALDNARLYTEARRAQDEVIRASRLESQLMRTRLDALRAQLDPHFLFNALNTIAMLVRRQANQDALRGIVSLSELLRRSLAEQSALLVPLRSELPLLESYVAIEQLRFRDRLHVHVGVAPDTLDALVPGLLIQPLLENAIKHGIARRSDAGTVEVRSRRDADMLVLEVMDDGPGFPAGWDPGTSGGIGLANTRERLERLFDGTHQFEAHNGPGGGAVVTIRIPFQTTTVG
jgi:LytS/YehU family sensor histidine kinase